MDGDTLDLLLQGVAHVTPQSVIMIAIAGVLLYLGIASDYEPLLLLPIGAGCLLANLPLSPLIAEDGMLRVLYDMGIAQRALPAADLHRHRRADRLRAAAREPADGAARRRRPVRHLPHAAARAGVRLQPAARRRRSASSARSTARRRSTWSGILAPHLLGPITVAAYSYMALVPIIMPPIMRR